jgi:hypothetical protein
VLKVCGVAIDDSVDLEAELWSVGWVSVRAHWDLWWYGWVRVG